ncbi:cytosine permease [Candidatus Fukatsuia symbiotica]|nr:cytosine permease [Candidatus Fukatsuia symbiotica]MEA9444465.1 cytosine permease [Candidatus Fukatsuia symbiotica]
MLSVVSPLAMRSSLFSITLIRIGVTTALSQFMLGATLGHSMTFGQAMLATLIGSLILEFIGLGLGIAGAREGLSTSLLSRWCGFGRFGSVLIGLMIAISLLGWFGVQNAVFAKSLNHAFGSQLGFIWSAILTGIAITTLVVFGFRALSWTAIISVPLFFLVIGWIVVILLQGHNVIDLITSIPNGVPITPQTIVQTFA